ncbi:hypothetical protein IP88_04870 [alpha proteobacterium AAP81b]|nr:hypothetical protein IP88_04870 [alpha proteobacterium AAP81b]
MSDAAARASLWRPGPMADARIKLPMVGLALLVSGWAFLSGKRIPLWTLTLSASIGLALLAATLLPALLLRGRILPGWAPHWRALLKKRRTLGLMAALCFWVHYNFAVEMLRQRHGPAEIQARYDPVLDPGQLAAFIFLILFLTSYEWARRLLKQDWKRLQSLVWFAVPLILVHSIAAKRAFEGRLTDVSLAILAAIIGLAVAEFFRLGVGHRDRFRHPALLALGLIVALVLRFGFRDPTIL